MKISVITVCFNNESTIEDTLKSVRNQHDAEVEHILIDGGSSDNTLEIIKKYPHVSTLISEPDNGIYDAMNKGIQLATGDIVGTLNADDFYADENVLTKVEQAFSDDSVDACYADLVYVQENNVHKVVRFWKSQNYKQGLFKSGWMPAHPTFFVKRELYDKYGLFDLNYKIAADVELLFRFIERHKIRTKYIPKVLVKMRLGGTTNKNLKNIWIQNKEVIRMLKEVYPNFSIVRFVSKKFINRALQFIRQP